MTTIPKMRWGPLLRHGYPKEQYLERVRKRLAQVQSDLDIWICSPTKEGILTTHRLEDEKKLILGIIALVEAEKVPSVVLDPFAGSGTTLLVASKLGRKSVGYELSEEYCALAVERNKQGVMI